MIEKVKRVDQDDSLYRSMLEEPTLVNANQRMIHNRNLEAFICHIIDQDYESAFRRDRVSFGQMKNDEFKAMYRWYKNPVSEGVRVRLERFYRIMKKEMP